MTVYIAVLWVLGFVMLGSGLVFFGTGAWWGMHSDYWRDREDAWARAFGGIVLAGIALWPLWGAASMGAS